MKYLVIFAGIIAVVILVLLIALLVFLARRYSKSTKHETTEEGRPKAHKTSHLAAALSIAVGVTLTLFGVCTVLALFGLANQKMTGPRASTDQSAPPALHYILRYTQPGPGKLPMVLPAEIVRNDDLRLEVTVWSPQDRGIDGKPEISHYVIDKTTRIGSWRSTAGRGGYMHITQVAPTSSVDPIIVAGLIGDKPRDQNGNVIVPFEIMQGD